MEEVSAHRHDQVNLDDRNPCCNPRKLPNPTIWRIACRRSAHIGGDVTISIARTAFEVIAAALPTDYSAEGRPDGKGGYLVTLDRHVIERFAGRCGGHASPIAT
jgi:hypothetical protein